MNKRGSCHNNQLEKLILENFKDFPSQTQLARHLNYSRRSVGLAVKRLKQQGYVIIFKNT